MNNAIQCSEWSSSTSLLPSPYLVTVRIVLAPAIIAKIPAIIPLCTFPKPRSVCLSIKNAGALLANKYAAVETKIIIPICNTMKQKAAPTRTPTQTSFWEPLRQCFRLDSIAETRLFYLHINLFLYHFRPYPFHDWFP